MKIGRALDGLDERRCLATLSEMVKFRSYSGTEGERALADWLVVQMSAVGFDSELGPVPEGRFNAVGRLAGRGGGGNSLLFNGHIDTNPVTEGWTLDPWGGLVDDTFIYGIGVSNMKAGGAAYLCAARTLLEAGFRLQGDLILTYVVGELQGGVGTVAALESGLVADYFINSEPTDLAALTMHAASLGFTIELIGTTRHLSKREEAVDAIVAACDLIPRINCMTFRNAKSESHLSINRGHVGVVHGALGREMHEWRSPQVSDFVRLRGVARYAPGQSREDVLLDVQSLLDGLCARFPGLQAVLIPESEGLMSMPPFEVPRGSRIVQALNAAYRHVRGEDQTTGVIVPPGFYGTDAGHLYARGGMEGIVCGPGGRYNTMPDERVDISDYLDMIRIYMLTIAEVCVIADN